MFKRHKYPYELEQPNLPGMESMPYRTPAQAYPHHHQETQEVVTHDYTEEQTWDGTSLEIEEPETVIGEGLTMRGELKFRRFLRIDGEFEGELVSEGKLVVGPTGVVRSNVELREAIIEGCVEGNITVRDRLELRGDAKIYGDVTARLLSVDEGVTLIGQVRVKPLDESEPELN